MHFRSVTCHFIYSFVFYFISSITMGNISYRPSPRKTFSSSVGKTSRFEFAANQITGWRHSQEDRYVCIPHFKGDVSLFAVFDGHGGEEVAQYLERFFHHFLLRELEVTADIELALYLSFLNCDSSLRTISAAEYALIEKDLIKEFEVPDKAERRQVLFNSIHAAGTSGEHPDQTELYSEISKFCLQELPSVSYLVQEPLQESDSNDEEYHPGDEVTEMFESENSGSTEDDTPDDDTDHLLLEEENIKSASCLEMDHASNSIQDITDSKDKEVEEKIEKRSNEEKGNEKGKNLNIKIGENCGSTATVLLINQTKLFIAHVGDSRCVACVKGQALDLTSDHRPNNLLEKERILNAGGYISADNRIQSAIDMSRAFDFCFKMADQPFEMVSAEPHISSIDITEDLEFVIIASDGIWNMMESEDVVNYIKNRLSDASLLPEDLIGELFLELLPEEMTPDGSGCDNMSAILINFQKIEGTSINSDFCLKEVYEYRNLSINKNSLTNKSSADSHDVDSKESNQSKYEEKMNECIKYSEAAFCNETSCTSENKSTQTDYIERNLSYQNQQLHRSNKKCNPAPSVETQTDQGNSIMHASVMAECLTTVTKMQKVIRSACSELSRVKLNIDNEMRRFDLQSYVTNAVHSEQNPSPSNRKPSKLDEINDEEMPEVIFVAPPPVKKNRAVIKSNVSTAGQSFTMQAEPNPIDHTNKAVKTIEQDHVEKSVIETHSEKTKADTLEQSVQQDRGEKAVIKTPTEKTEGDTPEQSVEQVGVEPDPVDHTNEAVKTPEQVQAEKSVTETPMEKTEADTPEQSVQQDRGEKAVIKTPSEKTEGDTPE